MPSVSLLFWLLSTKVRASSSIFDSTLSFAFRPFLTSLLRPSNSKDHVDVVKILVANGADKTIKGGDGKTAKESTGNSDILAVL